jgi:DNA-binding response OmpR family regulator
MARVLVIEELSDVRMMLIQVLQRAGHQVYDTANATGGLALAHTLQPDVILLDLELHELNGWAVLRLFNACGTTRNIPVIGVTTQLETIYQIGNTPNRLAAILEKPFDIRQLLDRIAAIVPRVANPLESELPLSFC